MHVDTNSQWDLSNRDAVAVSKLWEKSLSKSNGQPESETALVDVMKSDYCSNNITEQIIIRGVDFNAPTNGGTLNMEVYTSALDVNIR